MEKSWEFLNYTWAPENARLRCSEVESPNSDILCFTNVLCLGFLCNITSVRPTDNKKNVFKILS